MIYFMRDETNHFIKIGFTAGDGEGRLRHLQTGSPGQLVLLLQMEGSKQDESAWHQRFAGARERGEWFRPVPELLLAISEAKLVQLQEQYADLEAKFDAERERADVATRQLNSLSASLLHGRPLSLRGETELQTERDSRQSVARALGNIARMLEGPAVLPVEPAAVFGV